MSSDNTIDEIFNFTKFGRVKILRLLPRDIRTCKNVDMRRLRVADAIDFCRSPGEKVGEWKLVLHKLMQWRENIHHIED
jgi:hypothetical protein